MRILQNIKYYSLTHPQTSIWNVEKFYNDTAFGNIVGTVIFKEKVNLSALEKAINIFVQHNDSVRLILCEDVDKAKQYFAEYQEFKIDRFDFTYESGSKAFESWVNKQTKIPFKTTTSELFYFALINLTNNQGGFYIKLHHLICDAWGITLSISQIVDNYWKIINNQPIDSTSKPSYRDYILLELEYRKSAKFLAHKSFWEKKFESVPELTMFKARKNTLTTKANRKTFVLSTEMTNEINRFCSEHNVSIFTLFFTILAVYVHRITFKQDLVIGTPVLNRINYKQKHTVGMFISTIPVRTYVDPNLEFQDFLKVTSREWKQVLRNQQYPYDLLLRSYRQKHKVSENLIDISISYQNAKFDIENIKYKSKWHFNGAITESLAIHISDREDEGRLLLDFDYLQDLFNEDEIAQMNGHLLNLLKDAMKYSYKKLSDLQLLSTNERNQLLYDFNQTKMDYPKTRTIHRLFEEQVEKTPDYTAVVFEDQKLSYSELNEQSNQFARTLTRLGVKPDSVVAILLNRSIDMIVAMIAILKAGAAYLPVDPEYPDDRIQYILSDSVCDFLVTHSQVTKSVHVPGEILYIDKLCLDSNDGTNIETQTSSCNLAYLVYTSGSTGNPKGVMIEHKSIVNTLFWRKNYYGFNPKDAVLQLPSYAFDSSIEDIFTPLISGAKLILVDQKKLLSTTYLGRLIRTHAITNLLTVPSFLRQLLNSMANQLNDLRCITVAGEALSTGLIRDYFKSIHNVQLFNEYGPTENSVCTTVFEILPNDRRVLIGHPINNNYCYIVDKYWNLLPIGFVGELCVSGVGLARGYFNKQELTNQKFIENPFEVGTRLYPTGDLAKWLPDGNIEFIGRIDDQVKLRGFRIELSEIEACINNFPGIKDSAVTINAKNEKTKLVAYLVSDKSLSISHLKKYLLVKLPKHMIPSLFVSLEVLPLTPNGKLNKKALQTLELNYIVADYEPPHNDIERILVNLWKEVLEVSKVSINDNFFELGGDSLAIVEMLTALFEHNWNLTAQNFYEYPTIKELAVKILGKGEIRTDSERNLPRNVFYLKRAPLPNEEQLLQYDMEEALNQISTVAEVQPLNPNSQRHNFKGVLLTGATGFLGIHVLAELLSHRKTKVYCLVRGENSVARLSQSLEYYFPGQFLGLLGDRIIVLNGDISQHKFGLIERDYQLLGGWIDTVIHSAALVKHYGDYHEFERVNVLGTQEVVNFCNTFGQRMGHISTVSVGGNDLVDRGENVVFTENDFGVGQSYFDNVYMRSKIEAENILYQSTDLGLKATVFRVGMLMGRYSDGHFQRNISENAMYNRLKSIIKLEVVPLDILTADLDFTPVDYCARAIVEVLLTDAAEGRVFHLFNHNTLVMSDFIRMLGSQGTTITAVSTCEFKQLVESIARDKDRKKLLSGLVTDFDQDKTLHYSSSVKVDSNYTQQYLKQLDFEWPNVTAEYLQKLVIHIKAVGFLV